MGEYFSKEPDDYQVMTRSNDGSLKVYTTNNLDQFKDCTLLPDVLENNVAYAFLSTSGKNLNPHVYKDDECDITGNEPVTEPSPWENKSVNTILHSSVSNARYFMLNEDPINTPKFGRFIDPRVPPSPESVEYARKSSFQKCVRMPMSARVKVGNVKKDIERDPNSVAMAYFTDSDCNNEYITDIPAIPNHTYANDRRYNRKNRQVASEIIPLTYTTVKALEYSAPSDKTNAMYYKSYRPIEKNGPHYPKNMDS